MTLLRVRARNHPQQLRLYGHDDYVNTRTTPDHVWRDAEAEFGPFTLDVAAAPDNARCEHFYTVETDGLVQPWSGRVWCNPPYSQVGRWVAKAVEEYARCDAIVMLVPANRTEQRWWQTLVEPTRDRIGTGLVTRFLPGRLEFGPPAKDGKGNRPPFGCVLLIWRPTSSLRACGERERR